MKYKGKEEENRVKGLVGSKGQGNAGSDPPPTDQGEQEDSEEEVGPHSASHGGAVGNDVWVEEEGESHGSVGIEGGGDCGKERLSFLAVTSSLSLLLDKPLLGNYLSQPCETDCSKKIRQEEQPVDVGPLKDGKDSQGERSLMEDNPLVRSQAGLIHEHTLSQSAIRVEWSCHL